MKHWNREKEKGSKGVSFGAVKMGDREIRPHKISRRGKRGRDRARMMIHTMCEYSRSFRLHSLIHPGAHSEREPEHISECERSEREMIKQIGKFVFEAPSRRAGKKYDVYDAKTDKYITSFGALGYEHYFDKIGHYARLNHLDKNRRRLYRLRHQNDHIDDKTKAGYFSWRYLW